MDINIWGYLTFWNVALVILALPLAAMLITMPFLGVIPKGVKTGINYFGYLGGAGSCLVAIECAYRTIYSIRDYKFQTPKYFSNSLYEPFDSTPLIYLIVFAVITIATWFVADIYATKIEFRRAGRKYSEKNPLNLND